MSGPFWIAKSTDEFYSIGKGDVMLAPAIPREVAHLWKASPKMLEALKGIMALIESGKLVRDISADDHPDYALMMIDLVQKLQAAELAILEGEARFEKA